MSEGPKTGRIHTHYEPPPIPVRSYDWSAVTDDYEPGDPVGYGPTEGEALDDLRSALALYEDKP